jgi:hypothetical protein
VPDDPTEGGQYKAGVKADLDHYLDLRSRAGSFHVGMKQARRAFVRVLSKVPHLFLVI